MRTAIYEVSSGAIRGLLACELNQIGVNVGPWESAVVVPDWVSDELHWIDEAGQAQAKADYELAALPLPCTVTIEGVEYHCTTQPEFDFDAPGTYIIAVDAGPRYLKKEFSIENTPLLA